MANSLAPKAINLFPAGHCPWRSGVVRRIRLTRLSLLVLHSWRSVCDDEFEIDVIRISRQLAVICLSGICLVDVLLLEAEMLCNKIAVNTFGGSLRKPHTGREGRRVMRLMKFGNPRAVD